MAQSPQRLGYRRIVTLLVGLVIVPTVLTLATAIVQIVRGHVRENLVFGLLYMSFVVLLVVGAVLVLLFVRREAKLSELQADFVSKVSHELRTPLTSVAMFVEALEHAKEDTALFDECVVQLRRESTRLQQMIERLLDWGKMEAGRRVYVRSAVLAAEVIDRALDLYGAERYPEVPIERVDLAPGARVFADANALADALANLLHNARKYGGESGPVVIELVRGPSGTLDFSVRDRGPGIARNEQRRVFQKFYRVDDRLGRQAEGSGLGLAIVKHIVSGHGGRVLLRSEPNKGTCVTLRIGEAR